MTDLESDGGATVGVDSPPPVPKYQASTRRRFSNASAAAVATKDVGRCEVLAMIKVGYGVPSAGGARPIGHGRRVGTRPRRDEANR